MKNRGFTLIELLIVVALIGILAIALLSAINPIEQAKKARDAGRKSDSAELLNAYERYNTTYGCFPWNGGAGDVCATSSLSPADNPAFGTDGNSYNLISTNELKEQFKNRTSVTKNEMFISELNGPNGAVSVCFEPESQSWRSGGGGMLRNQDNTSTVTTADCMSGSYLGGDCYVCVPQ